MSIEVKAPPLPESVSDATVLTWHRQPGDRIKRDETLLDLETDKVVLEVPAPIEGILGEILASEGSTVTPGQLLTTIDSGSDSAVAPTPSEERSSSSGPTLSPAVRRLVQEMNIDTGMIQGSGKNGRILKSDVLAHLESLEAEMPEDEPAPSPTPATNSAEGVIPLGGRPEQRVPMTRLRARIAERLVEAQQTAAILTTFNEVNLQQVMELRSRYRDSFEKQHGVRLGFMSFFIRAVIEGLKHFPVVNASVDGSDIIYHGYYDVGVAVGSPRGLVVPILRDADQLSFAEIEKSIKTFGKNAAEGTLSYDELSGGTFTISNGGVYGSMLSTPILNPPQSAILGMHNITERPVVENGEIVIRPMMYLALSYDHRIIDGREAVQFLVSVKENLEDPARMMLQL